MTQAATETVAERIESQARRSMTLLATMDARGWSTTSGRIWMRCSTPTGMRCTGERDMEPYEITYFKESAPPRFALADTAGVLPGWLVIWNGRTGPGHVMKVAALTEDDGSFHIVPDGEFTECTVVDMAALLAKRAT